MKRTLIILALFSLPLVCFGQGYIIRTSGGKIVRFGNSIVRIDTTAPITPIVSCDSIVPCDAIIPCDAIYSFLEYSKENSNYNLSEYYKHEEILIV